MIPAAKSKVPPPTVISPLVDLSDFNIVSNSVIFPSKEEISFNRLSSAIFPVCQERKKIIEKVEIEGDFSSSSEFG